MKAKPQTVSLATVFLDRARGEAKAREAGADALRGAFASRSALESLRPKQEKALSVDLPAAPFLGNVVKGKLRGSTATQIRGAAILTLHSGGIIMTPSSYIGFPFRFFQPTRKREPLDNLAIGSTS